MHYKFIYNFKIGIIKTLKTQYDQFMLYIKCDNVIIIGYEENSFQIDLACSELITFISSSFVFSAHCQEKHTFTY